MLTPARWGGLSGCRGKDSPNNPDSTPRILRQWHLWGYKSQPMPSSLHPTPYTLFLTPASLVVDLRRILQPHREKSYKLSVMSKKL
ncbi:hypothetical protein H6G76_21210 [Nostoc sp. FACHB-152]|uniref:hypothetical protein n=1 Tax=Nostoc sp. FACHB-145 TaxID=2692836 RepID=UPI0016895D3C|nr:hypothetical protein [Nostoc sp. FACHB-145]MBD2449640.1 hypothetical protein [Nostoc sp. FACHB-152]MBD2469696.1 hypothetical protein [Nostoc sp. FACHB-145]